MDTPLLTVVITCYNQQATIAQAIESVLMQETDFPFNIFISDDASTDDTPHIVQEYSQRYPEQIQCRLRDNNVGISCNWFEALIHTKSEYITTLEGDDYWTSSHKLQRQIDFLQSNAEYSGVGHVVQLLDANEKPYGYAPVDKRIVGKDCSIPLYFKGAVFACTPVVYRNFFRGTNNRFRAVCTANRSIADFSISLLIMDQGLLRILDSPMANYRTMVNSPSQTNYNASRKTLEKYEDHLEATHACADFFGKKYNFISQYIHMSFFPFFDSLRNRTLNDFWLAFKKVPWQARMACLFIYPFWLVKGSVGHRLRRLLGKCK